MRETRGVITGANGETLAVVDFWRVEVTTERWVRRPKRRIPGLRTAEGWLCARLRKAGRGVDWQAPVMVTLTSNDHRCLMGLAYIEARVSQRTMSGCFVAAGPWSLGVTG